MLDKQAALETKFSGKAVAAAVVLIGSHKFPETGKRILETKKAKRPWGSRTRSIL